MKKCTKSVPKMASDLICRGSKSTSAIKSNNLLKCKNASKISETD